ncbi:MAG TPA: thiamine/thiamine pyrophosphate ABC transporter permease ThiP, partial [Rhodobacter sp.]|nr:thiamine/thiamine pyrophosphate ABC transporter permease ThiP [Rhodobacter sp.]
MARSAVSLTLVGVTAVLGLLLIGPLAAVIWRADQGLTALDIEAVRFTLWQAALSASLSVALAVPLARALYRRRFYGRGAIISLLG